MAVRQSLPYISNSMCYAHCIVEPAALALAFWAHAVSHSYVYTGLAGPRVLLHLHGADDDPKWQGIL
jgi:hypothetical protein